MDINKKVLVMMILSFMCFWGVRNQAIEKWDESTNISVVTGSGPEIITGRMYSDGHVFMEKPPLWFILTYLISSRYGNDLLSYRFVSIVSALLLFIFLLFVWMPKYSNFKKAGLWASWVILSSGGVWQTNAGDVFATHTFRSADQDSLQILLMIGAAWMFSKSIYPGSGIFRILGLILSSAAVLTKGPFGIIPWLIYTFINLRKVGYTGYLSRLTTDTVVLIMLVMPWHIFMYILWKNEFLSVYLGHHLFQRFFSVIEGHQPKSYLYYLSLLVKPNIFLFSDIYLIAFIIWRKWASDYFVQICTYTSLLVIVIISLAQTKLAWYLLPFYIFSAPLIGAFISDITSDLKIRSSPKQSGNQIEKSSPGLLTVLNIRIIVSYIILKIVFGIGLNVWGIIR